MAWLDSSGVSSLTADIRDLSDERYAPIDVVDTIGSSELTTTAQTLTGAINELDADLDGNVKSYTQGTGITISGTTISNSGVRSVASGSTNGTISVNTNGTSEEVAVAGLGSAAYTASTSYLASSLKGANSGVAELDANGKVPSSQLPSYVDDVVEYDTLSVFPETGEAGKIYVDKYTNLTYRWGGSSYVAIASSLALGTTSGTAYRGDYGDAAYQHAVTNAGSAFSSGLYKITTNSEGHVTAATAVVKSDITDLGIPGSDTDTHRPIQVNGTEVLGSNTTVLNLAGGTNVSISESSGTVTISATDTTYESKVAAENGTDVSLVTTAEKYAWNNKTSNTGTVTNVSAGVGLAGGDITTTGTVKAKLRSETALTNDSVAATETSGRVYPVAVDNSGYLAVNVPWTDSDTTYSEATTTTAGLLSATDKTTINALKNLATLEYEVVTSS